VTGDSKVNRHSMYGSSYKHPQYETYIMA